MEEVRRDAADKVRRSAQGATQQPRRDAVPYRQGLVKPPYGYVSHLPNRTIREVCLSLDTSPATFLAYVEWFSLLMAIPDPALHVSSFKIEERWSAARRNYPT